MATYPGMNLRGEVRESVSLDEDDLSDVEDEVFIRDGKNGYKFEDLSAKKPLMAPRRKSGRSDLRTRIKSRPSCKLICKLCCYTFIALTVLIGLTVVVIVLASLFPLPVDKLKEWIINKTNEQEPLLKVVPCNDIKVTDVWTMGFPNMISESPVQILDVNLDGIDDIIFGFGTASDNTMPQQLFCAALFGIAPPCQGGVMALNGSNGNILWRQWLPHSVFTVVCTVDVNADNITDCLITGKGGIFSVLSSKNGHLIWEYPNKDKDSTLLMDIYWANFIPDQDNDSIPDILASHTLQKGRLRSGYLMVISGKTGKDLQKVPTPNDIEIYYTPQLLKQNDGNHTVLFGTGSPTVPGNLSAIPLKELLSGNMTPSTLYHDPHKGVLLPGVLVDINGDTQPDIIVAMFNSSIVAIDGKTFKQIWNYTVLNSQTLSIPTPGYFNDDNVTDFLIKYQRGPDFPTYYYSQTFILDGKTGKPIYSKPVIDSVGSQMAGLTLGMENRGSDFFLYWTADCKNFEGNQEIFEFIPGSTIHQQSHADLCKLRFNSSMVTKLYAINQFDQPPGVEIYNSESRVALEYNITKTSLEVVKDYLIHHPEIQYHSPDANSDPITDDSETNQDYDQTQDHLKTVKYKDGSSFRHKDNGQGLIRDFSRDDNKRRKSPNQKQLTYDSDFEPAKNWQQKVSVYPNDDLEADYNTYIDEPDTPNMYRSNKLLVPNTSNRDPRSKTDSPTLTPLKFTTENSLKLNKILKKNLSEQPKYGIYDYKNIKKAHTRLMHDLNNIPTEILRDTYYKNRENQLRKSRFEQRDLKSHQERIRENEDVRKVIEHERNTSLNLSETLWDLESEKEEQDRKNGYWRGKREVDKNKFIGIPKLTSIGALANALQPSNNAIDLIFVTYWLPPKKDAQILVERDFKCINDKLKKALDSKEEMHTADKETLEELFMKECLHDRGVIFTANTHNDVNLDMKNFRNIPYFNQISQLSLGQLTVYRLRLECVCLLKKGERCASFLSAKDQYWSSYLGRKGDGAFKIIY